MPLGLWGRPALSASADRVFDATETFLLRASSRGSLAQSTHSVSSAMHHEVPLTASGGASADASPRTPFHAHPKEEVALIGAAPLVGWQEYLSLCSVSSPPAHLSPSLASSPKLLPTPMPRTLEDDDLDE